MFMALAPADNSCSHGGTLGCGLVKLTTPITSGASVRRRFSTSISGAGAPAGLALEHDEAPRRELAVVRHPRANGQDGIELGRRGAGPRHLARFHRASGLQEFNGVGHSGFLGSRLSERGYIQQISAHTVREKRI